MIKGLFNKELRKQVKIIREIATRPMKVHSYIVIFITCFHCGEHCRCTESVSIFCDHIHEGLIFQGKSFHSEIQWLTEQLQKV